MQPLGNKCVVEMEANILFTLNRTPWTPSCAIYGASCIMLWFIKAFLLLFHSLICLSIHNIHLNSSMMWCLCQPCRLWTGRPALLTLQLYVFKENASRQAAMASWTLIGSLISVVYVAGTTRAARRSQECSPNQCEYQHMLILTQHIM